MPENDRKQEERPKVGIGVVVVRGNKILIGQRLSGHGAGTFEIPGGHLEFGETFEDAALREVREETGLTNLTVRGIVSLGNDIVFNTHYVSVGVCLECASGEPNDPEPEHSKNWQWCDMDKLPQPIFPHSKRVIQNWLAGTMYS